MRTVILTAKTSGTHVFYDTFASPTIGTHVFYDTFASPTIGTHVFYDTFASPTIETHVFYDTFKLLNSKTSGNTETVAIFHIFFAILPKINEECNHIVYVFSTPLDSNARFF
jgi:hypothetical protein